jgi:hypothetical protein
MESQKVVGRAGAVVTDMGEGEAGVALGHGGMHEGRALHRLVQIHDSTALSVRVDGHEGIVAICEEVTGVRKLQFRLDKMREGAMEYKRGVRGG